jgi:class 3 adenylate cyclase
MANAAPVAAHASPSSAFRVLVVDDDPDMANLLCTLLRTEGLHADTIGDGDAALASVAASPPDLILLDVVMSGSSGFEVCERLRADDATALIPIVLVTALDDRVSRVRGIEAGADDFLSKPVYREELIARVNTLRRLHETRRELESRRLAAEIQRKENIKAAFSRYISPNLATRIIDRLGENGELFGGRPERIDVVALFADLRGFTRLTERSEVGEVVQMLNEYFTILTEAAYQNGGTIFNMAGDSMLVGFNVPFAQPDAPERAWGAARGMVSRFAPVAAEWETRHGVPTGIGVGICSGEVIVGNVGSPHYMNYTVIGDPVNTAARLMQLAASNEVLVCERVYEGIRRTFPAIAATPRGSELLRGKSGPVQVFSLKASDDGDRRTSTGDGDSGA